MVTNPDVFQRWVGIIKGTDPQHHLAHGYYLTMQQRYSPDSTWQETLQQEGSFFNTHPLWSELPQSASPKIGCLELRKKLSVELSGLIKGR